MTDFVMPQGAFEGVPITRVPATALQRLVSKGREPIATFARNELERRHIPVEGLMLISMHAIERATRLMKIRRAWLNKEPEKGIFSFLMKHFKKTVKDSQLHVGENRVFCWIHNVPVVMVIQKRSKGREDHSHELVTLWVNTPKLSQRRTDQKDISGRR